MEMRMNALKKNWRKRLDQLILPTRKVKSNYKTNQNFHWNKEMHQGKRNKCNFLNGTAEEVKKIVTMLNEAEVLAEDVVAKGEESRRKSL
ncbi:hypothetical protein LWI28_026321 [Acer negundo]|uniref:Uncharacterized protein n=1 Tax=Acer negundo TaxID=4023 RepID=A0AAD5JBL3_ACENE|nr:hypothetical protein LWI28_026321 [Acer negundo]